jgi:hypothetical protein
MVTRQGESKEEDGRSGNLCEVSRVPVYDFKFSNATLRVDDVKITKKSYLGLA